MKSVKCLVLFWLILTIISCRSQTASEFFKRPKVNTAINSNCTGFVNGEAVDVTNWISVSPEDYATIEEYFESREFCNYICIKYPKRCKGCK